jgi:hypothetical protein
MPAPYDRMGYERQLFYGTAGTTGTTQLTNVVDINHDIALEFGDTTVRGDSATLPIGTQKPTKRTPNISWQMRDQPNDADLVILRAAAKAGTAVALVIKEFNSAGVATTIFDGDCNVTVSEGHPLAGEATFDFEGTATRDHGRLPVF